MNIVLVGCGGIAHRVACGIHFSKATLYGVASRSKQKAEAFAKAHQIDHIYTFEECLADPCVELVYLATPNPTHYALTMQALTHHKHVICEKPFVSSEQEVHELFEVARQNDCFLMEAHKTCFTPLNQLLRQQIEAIGPIQRIEASYCTSFDLNHLQPWHVEASMGGSFYDVGVYPLCFSMFYAQSEIKKLSFQTAPYPPYECDFDCACELDYENGIHASLSSSWSTAKENKGCLIGEKGSVEIINFWKNTEASMTINGNKRFLHVEQDSDFSGEIDHAVDCIKDKLIESPIMSEKATAQIAYVLEEMKKVRGYHK